MNTDALIELALSQKPSETEKLNEAQRFIIAFKIKIGKKKVKASQLYHIYKNWSKRPISKRLFVCQINKYFISEGAYHCYNLNYQPWELDCKCRELTEGYEKKQ